MGHNSLMEQGRKKESKMQENDRKPHINVDYFEDLTGEISNDKPTRIEEIGQRIRTLREEKGLGLEELSNLTGFDIDLLSGIEKNEVFPQLGTVMRLSKALDGAFSRLVSGVGEKLYAITRKGEQRAISRSTAKTGKKKLYSYKSLASDVKGRNMEALLVQLEVNPDLELSVHEGEEFIYVLEGVAMLRIGEETHELEPGDSVYYLSTTPHLIAAKEGKATILAVLYEG
jgi:quercetin dioxygenase-like cupin family protein/ribosome-binding protein aMBF1 (putative translation factor)